MFVLIQIWLIMRYCKTSSVKDPPRINSLQKLEKLSKRPAFIRSDTVNLSLFVPQF